MPLAHPVTVTAHFDVSGAAGTFFTVEHATLGALDTGGPLAGDLPFDLTNRVHSININRGRSRELDEIPAGTCRLGFRNLDRTFDPANEDSTLYPNIAPGKRMQVEIYGVTIFDGVADDWDNSYAHGRRTAASVLCVDALGLLARKDFDAWTTTSQTAGPRMSAVLARPEVNYTGNRSLDFGAETLQADNVSWGSNVLNYLQLVAKSDRGRLFASRMGVLTYRDRMALGGATIRFTFTDHAPGFAFSGITKRSAAELLYTRVGVDRTSGTLQTRTNTAAAGTYGVRTLSLGGLLLNSDAQSAALAEYLLAIYSQPEDRIAALTVNVSRVESLADQVTLSSLEIGDMVNLEWTPLGVGDPIVRTLIVEGVAHRLAQGEPHLMTLSLTSSQSVFILDDAIFGLLDGAGVLA